MRIIGGELASAAEGSIRRQKCPIPGRPPISPKRDCSTSSENNLDLPSLKTLDLFGGTGSISFELASRGVPDLTVVEKDPGHVRFYPKDSGSDSGWKRTIKVVRMDVFRLHRTVRRQLRF